MNLESIFGSFRNGVVMLRTTFLVLVFGVFMRTCVGPSFAENAFTEVNRYILSNTYITPKAVLSEDATLLYDVQQVWLGAEGYSSTFKVLEKTPDGNFQQVQALGMAGAEAYSLEKISFLLLSGKYLLAVCDDYNEGRVVHRFAIDEQGLLSFHDSYNTGHSAMAGWKKPVSAGDGKFFQSNDALVSLWQYSVDGILTHLADVGYQGQTEFLFRQHLFSAIEDDQMLHLMMSKDSDNERLVFEIRQLSIDWDNGTLQEISYESLQLGNPYYSRGYDIPLNMLVKSDLSAVYFRSTQYEYIFKGIGSGTISLAMANSESLGSLTVSQVSEQLYEAANPAQKLSIDWDNEQVIRQSISGGLARGKLYIVSDTMLLKTDADGREGRLWRLNSELESQAVSVSDNNYGRLPPDRYSQPIFDQASASYMIVADANDSPKETEPTLYVWKYQLEQNDMVYVGASRLIETDPEVTLVSDSPLGSYAGYYYTVKKRSSGSSIDRFVEEHGELQGIESVDLNSSDEGVYVDEVFFANEDTIVAELYGPDISGLVLNVCHLGAQGQLDSCNHVPAFEELGFSEDLTRYTFHKLSHIGQFLFAPETVSDFFIVEFEEDSFAIKQRFSLPQNQTIERIVSFNKSEFFLDTDDGGLKRFEWDGQQWSEANLENERIHFPYGLSGTNSYMLDRNGKSYVYEPQNYKLWATNQTVNLKGWFQLVGQDKGFVVDINNDSSSIVTFELANSAPTIYKGGLINGAEYEAIQDSELQIDFAKYFINPKDTIYVEGASKFLVENGILSVTLNNDDIIKGEYSDGSKMYVSVYGADRYIGYIYIEPVNINDPPELIVTINREYLKVNEAYEANLNDYVQDPDRDYVTYEVTGLPSGFSIEGSYIRGTSSTEGNYNIKVSASDQSGGNLLFTIPVTLNQSGQVEQQGGQGSSGGGTIAWLNLFLVILLFKRLAPLQIYIAKPTQWQRIKAGSET